MIVARRFAHYVGEKLYLFSLLVGFCDNQHQPAAVKQRSIYPDCIQIAQVQRSSNNDKILFLQPTVLFSYLEFKGLHYHRRFRYRRTKASPIHREPLLFCSALVYSVPPNFLNSPLYRFIGLSLPLCYSLCYTGGPPVVISSYYVKSPPYFFLFLFESCAP